MAICGLVLAYEAVAKNSVVKQLRAMPKIEIGPIYDCRLPLVLEFSGGVEQYRRHWQRLQGLEGVAHVDLVYAYYEEAEY